MTARKRLDEMKQFMKIAEGAWELPRSKEDFDKLAAILKSKEPNIKVLEMLYNVLGDDDLFDRLDKLGLHDFDAPATIIQWMKDQRKDPYSNFPNIWNTFQLSQRHDSPMNEKELKERAEYDGVEYDGVQYPFNRVPIEYYTRFKAEYPGARVRFRGPKRGKRNTSLADATHFYIVSTKGDLGPAAQGKSDAVRKWGAEQSKEVTDLSLSEDDDECPNRCVDGVFPAPDYEGLEACRACDKFDKRYPKKGIEEDADDNVCIDCGGPIEDPEAEVSPITFSGPEREVRCENCAWAKIEKDTLADFDDSDIKMSDDEYMLRSVARDNYLDEDSYPETEATMRMYNKHDTDDFQNRGDDYPVSGIPVRIDAHSFSNVARLTFMFKNTPTDDARAFVSQFMQQHGLPFSDVEAWQSGDFQDDWVTAEATYTVSKELDEVGDVKFDDYGAVSEDRPFRVRPHDPWMPDTPVPDEFKRDGRVMKRRKGYQDWLQAERDKVRDTDVDEDGRPGFQYKHDPEGMGSYDIIWDDDTWAEALPYDKAEDKVEDILQMIYDGALQAHMDNDHLEVKKVPKGDTMTWTVYDPIDDILNTISITPSDMPAGYTGESIDEGFIRPSKKKYMADKFNKTVNWHMVAGAVRLFRDAAERAAGPSWREDEIIKYKNLPYRPDRQDRRSYKWTKDKIKASKKEVAIYNKIADALEAKKLMKAASLFDKTDGNTLSWGWEEGDDNLKLYMLKAFSANGSGVADGILYQWEEEKEGFEESIQLDNIVESVLQEYPGQPKDEYDDDEFEREQAKRSKHIQDQAKEFEQDRIDPKIEDDELGYRFD